MQTLTKESFIWFNCWRGSFCQRSLFRRGGSNCHLYEVRKFSLNKGKRWRKSVQKAKTTKNGEVRYNENWNETIIYKKIGCDYLLDFMH